VLLALRGVSLDDVALVLAGRHGRRDADADADADADDGAADDADADADGAAEDAGSR
jgi:hypothetical protein